MTNREQVHAEAVKQLAMNMEDFLDHGVPDGYYARQSNYWAAKGVHAVDIYKEEDEMSNPTKPAAGAYRLTSTGSQTAGQQMDVVIEPNDTINSPILGQLSWAPPPVSAFVSPEGEVALQFFTDPDHFVLILNQSAHGGDYAALPA